jgi:hypothetical protein
MLEIWISSEFFIYIIDIINSSKKDVLFMYQNHITGQILVDQLTIQQ